MKITWKQGRGLPVFIKGGAMGIVDGAPVYAAGCTFPWRETEQAWYWDAQRGDWFPVEPSLPLGRCYTHGITLADGLLLLGGRKSNGQERMSLRDAWWLRRRDGVFSWTPLPEMHDPRAITSIGVSGRRVLAFGGGEWERSQGGAFTTRHLTRYEILDLEDLGAGWQDMGPLPFASLVGSAFASVGDSAYMFGGYECWTEVSQRRIRRHASAWRYDFAADSWSQRADFPCRASGWAAVPHGNAIVLMGGGLALDLLGADVEFQTYHTVEKGTWRQRLVGGFSDRVFVYDIGADTYRLLEDRLPVGLHDLRCAISDNTIFAAAGETVDPPTSNCSNAFLIGTIEA